MNPEPHACLAAYYRLSHIPSPELYFKKGEKAGHDGAHLSSQRLRRLRQENLKFKASLSNSEVLGNSMRLCL